MGQMNPRPDDHVGMIGLFTPLIGRILATGARLTVVELKAELVGNSSGYCVTLDPGALSDCTKVISTSTLLLNDTLDRIVACCHKARWFDLPSDFRAPSGRVQAANLGSDWNLSHCFVNCCWTFAPERGVTASPVIKNFDVVKQIGSRLIASRVA